MTAASNSGDPPDQHVLEDLTPRVPPSPALTESYLVQHTSLPRPLAKQTARELRQSGGAIFPVDRLQRKTSRALVVPPKAEGAAANIASGEIINTEERKSAGLRGGGALLTLGSFSLLPYWFEWFRGSWRKTRIVRMSFVGAILIGAVGMAYLIRPSWASWPSFLKWPSAVQSPAPRYKPRPQPAPDVRDLTHRQFER